MWRLEYLKVLSTSHCNGSQWELEYVLSGPLKNYIRHPHLWILVILLFFALGYQLY